MVAKETTYRPFGEAVDFAVSLTPPETKGFIGERFDADSGLQYLNARYYDPKLGMFIQPDWFEVTMAGVGTNRYAYSGNDPVNRHDPGGNVAPLAAAYAVVCGGGACEAVATAVALALGYAAVDVTYDGELDGKAGIKGLGGVTGNSTGSSVSVGNTGATGSWGVVTERRVGDLEPIDAPGHNAPRPELEGLSDDDLIGAIFNPEDGQRIKVKGNRILDGNGRIKEARKRGLLGADDLIPVDELEEDEDMAPWEKEDDTNDDKEREDE
jgi:RHS repeat-associated protein